LIIGTERETRSRRSVARKVAKAATGYAMLSTTIDPSASLGIVLSG